MGYRLYKVEAFKPILMKTNSIRKKLLKLFQNIIIIHNNYEKMIKKLKINIFI